MFGVQGVRPNQIGNLDDLLEFGGDISPVSKGMKSTRAGQMNITMYEGDESIRPADGDNFITSTLTFNKTANPVVNLETSIL